MNIQKIYREKTRSSYENCYHSISPIIPYLGIEITPSKVRKAQFSAYYHDLKWEPASLRQI